MKKKPSKSPPPKTKKKKPAAKKTEKFSLKRLLMGEEKPDLTELESGSATILDILSPTTVDNQEPGLHRGGRRVPRLPLRHRLRLCHHRRLLPAPLVEAGEGVNLSFIFKRQPKDKILSKIAQTTMVNRSPVFLDSYDDYKYTNGNCWIGGSSGAGKTFTLQCLGGRLRQQGPPGCPRLPGDGPGPK